MDIKHVDFEKLKDEVFEFLRHRIDDVESMKFYDALRVIVNRDYREEFRKETGFDIDKIARWCEGESGRKRDDTTKE